MNPVEKLKLTTSTKILIALGSVIGTISLTLFVDLIQSSTAYAIIKTQNPIDAIINMEIPLQVSSQSILIALIALSLFFNLFLYKRNKLYYKAAFQFAKYFYYVGAKYKEATGSPVIFKTSLGEIEIGESPK